MVKVSIVVEGHDWAEAEFGDGPKVHGGEVPEAVLKKIEKDLSGGYRQGEYEEYKWQVIEH